MKFCAVKNDVGDYMDKEAIFELLVIFQNPLSPDSSYTYAYAYVTPIQITLAYACGYVYAYMITLVTYVRCRCLTLGLPTYFASSLFLLTVVGVLLFESVSCKTVVLANVQRSYICSGYCLILTPL